jgi:RNA polymerase sigma-70 factor, ECF subfamily
MSMLVLLAGQTDAVAASPEVAEIFAEHHGFVWRALSHLGVDRAELEDALQEVFVVVHRRLDDYREQQKVRAWLYAISVRVARDFRRKRSRRREQLTASPPDSVRDASQLESFANRQALELAQRLLSALPEQQRAVFLLYEVEQLPMSEVAQALDCPLHTAYSRLKKARERVLALVARAERKGDVP